MSPEVLSQPSIRFGVSLEALNEQVFEDALRIYLATAMSAGYVPDDILEDEARAVFRHLERDLAPGRTGAEYRFGSRYSPHSKLVISKRVGNLLSFSFDPNMLPGYWGYDEACGIIDEFRDNIETYLYSTGLAQPIIR